MRKILFMQKKIIDKIALDDSWSEKEQLKILSNARREEIESLIKMCTQILEEPWDEFSIISGYSLDELDALRSFLIDYASSFKDKETNLSL